MTTPTTSVSSSSRHHHRTEGEILALTLATLSITAVGVYFARSMVGPAFFALTLVITVRPLHTWMVRHQVPKLLAATATMTLIVVFILSLFVAMGVAIAQFVDALPDSSAKFQSLWDEGVKHLETMGVSQETLIEQLSKVVDASKVASLAQSVLGQVSNAGSMLLVLFLSIFFLTIDTMTISSRAAALAQVKPGLYDSLSRFSAAVRSYWAVSTIFGLIVAVFDTAVLMLLDVPMAVTWGVFSFITNYIPNLGFVIGVIPPAVLGLVNSGPWTAVWVVVAYSVLNFVIQSLIQPKFTGDAVGLNTTTTFLSLMLWTIVIGGLGSVLAVPLTLFAKAVLIDADPRSAWIGIFLTDGDKELPQRSLRYPAAARRARRHRDAARARSEGAAPKAPGDRATKPGDGAAQEKE